MLTYTGVLKVKKNEQQVSDRFKKREFVVSDNAPSYPQTILFQLTQDRCALLDNINLNDNVTVHFQLKGREWKSPQGEIKFFNTLDVFKIDKSNSSQNEAMPDEASEMFTPTPDDGLPF